MNFADAFYFVPFLVVITMGGWLSLVDFRSHRLPNRLVLITALLLIPNLVFANDLLIIMTFASGYLLIYIALYFASRQQLGMGDVKYAGVLGLAVGFYTDELVDLAMNTFILAGIVAAALLVSQRANLKTSIAFGPIMTVGAIYTIAVAI